jgi:N-acetylmuramoyl-L-alanine amidase
MFYLKRKMIYFVSTMLLLIGGITIYTAILSENKTIETVSLPVSNKTVVLDAGHGKPDEGAESSNGISEASINLKITKKVQYLLEQSGCNVILTRSDEEGIYDLNSKTLREKKVSDIKNRVKIGNSSSADVFVSIHLNKIPQSQYFGWQSFFKTNDEKSEELAKSIQEELNASIQKENKRDALKITGKYIIEHVEIPISIIECGFLSNPEEEKLLQDDNYQNRIAWGIYNGIMDYFYIIEK